MNRYSEELLGMPWQIVQHGVSTRYWIAELSARKFALVAPYADMTELHVATVQSERQYRIGHQWPKQNQKNILVGCIYNTIYLRIMIEGHFSGFQKRQIDCLFAF